MKTRVYLRRKGTSFEFFSAFFQNLTQKSYIYQKFFESLTDEGRLVPKAAGGGFEYEYFVKDHLGNTRLTVQDSSGIAAIKQENHYYPFGMALAGQSWQSPTYLQNRYLYNSKEMQDNLELDWYDYGARFYDAQIGRWHSLDPMGQFSSGYVYCGNNPVRMFDQTGMWSDDNNRKIIPPIKKDRNKSNTDKNFVLFNLIDWFDLLNEKPKEPMKEIIDNLENHRFVAFADKKRNSKDPKNQKPSKSMKKLAHFLYTSDWIPNTNLFKPWQENPFKGAVAIFGDFGVGILGQQVNGGGFFVLVGKDAGKFYAYSENAHGFASDGGLNGEVGKVDYSGDPNEFRWSYLYGERQKYFGGLGYLVISVGGSSATSYVHDNNGIKRTIKATSASVSLGFSILGSITVGGNYGSIDY